MRKFLIAFFFIGTNACVHVKKEIPYEYMQADVMYEDMVTKLPGSIFIKDSIFVWHDVFARDSFLNVINLNSRSPVGRYGKIGRGPQEFTTPMLGDCFNDEVIIYDANGSFQTIFQIGPYLKGEKQYKTLPYTIKWFCTAVVRIGNNEFVCLQPDQPSFLLHILQEDAESFGISPFNYEYTNGYDVNQGHIAYNYHNETLVYAMIGYPFLAIYRKYDDGFKLVGKNEGDQSYSFSKKKIILDSKRRGIFSIALTQNYIIAHQRDYAQNVSNERSAGLDVSKAPSTLFLYNYNGDLVKIVDLGVPIVRLNSNFHSRVLYAVVANPDYSLVRVVIDDEQQ